MIKKLIKFLLFAVVLGILLLGGGIFTLYKMYPPAKLKVMAQEYVAKNFQREIKFENISLTWIGFSLKNVALSENTTFADGTFIEAKKLTAHVAVKPLLQKRIEISTIEADELNIQLIQKQDGSFNFDTLIPTQDNPAPEENSTNDSSSTPLVVTAKKIALTDCDIVYKNLQTGMKLAFKDLDILINDFDLAKPFETEISFTTDISNTGQPDMTLPISIKAQINLANLDMPGAAATISQATARYKTVLFSMQGDVKNFESPQVNLTGSLAGINNKVLNELAPDLPNFTLPTINLTLQASADLDKSIAQINLAKLAVKNSALTAGGNLGWAGPTPTYTMAGTLTANLNELVQMTDTVQDFKPSGIIKGDFKATDKKDFTDVSGNITLQNVSALYPPVTLTETNGTILIASLDQISSPSIKGKLNNEKFEGSFSYQNIKNVINLVLNLNLDKLVLDSFSSQNSSPSTAQTDSGSDTANSDSRMNIQTNINVGRVKIPYVESDGFSLSANLTDITDSMTQANGNIQFTLKPGKITNLDDFIKDSKIAKIILLPVTLVKKVSGLLQLDLFPTDKTGNGTTISFTQGEGSYTFTDGIMNVDSTTFNSTVTDISANGTANFKTDELNMKATATLLTQAAPVSFKITGTMSNPKGKLDVLNTVGSVVGNLLNGTTVKSAAKGGANVTKETAQAAGDVVKSTVNTAADVVKGFGSLFKKKTPQEE